MTPEWRFKGLRAMQAMVKDILDNHERYHWSIQGFGMLRLKLVGDVRLNIWHPEYEYEPKPSLLHNHPWDFTSFILAGVVVNQRYILVENPSPGMATIPMKLVHLKPGEGTEILQSGEDVHVRPLMPEMYRAGDYYSQEWQELHVSHTILPGTITLNERDRGDRPDEADVLYDPELEWVTAEPRQATFDEVQRFCAAARHQLAVDMS